MENAPKTVIKPNPYGNKGDSRLFAIDTPRHYIADYSIEDIEDVHQALTKFLTEYCRECNRPHVDQIEQFPVNCRVVAITDINGSIDITEPGDIGVVTGHANDGRAFILFGNQSETHTFHEINNYVCKIRE